MDGAAGVESYIATALRGLPWESCGRTSSVDTLEVDFKAAGRETGVLKRRGEICTRNLVVSLRELNVSRWGTRLRISFTALLLKLVGLL